jgi:protein-S-isoprenylcysteine O-methyltransferase Ste14
MTNPEKINLEIDKQINAGFQPSEIRQNLLGLNFTEAEINEAFKSRNITAKATAKSSSQTSVVSLLISVFFIISGFMRMGNHSSGSMLYNWGIILVLVGIAGVVIKGIDLAKR